MKTNPISIIEFHEFWLNEEKLHAFCEIQKLKHLNPKPKTQFRNLRVRQVFEALAEYLKL